MAEGSQRDAIITDAWYPRPSDYWVPADEAEQPGAWPYRFGDLFNAPPVDEHGVPLTDKHGEPWHAVMVASPSCEMVSKARDNDSIEVVRVLRLDTQDPKAQAAIVAGWQEKGERVTVAFAHTVFLAPVPRHGTHAEPMFAHLKSTRRVPLASLREAGRVAALTHEARVCVIRRDLYYRYRWLVPMSDVAEAERARISNDPFFTPPRPDWAPLDSDA